MPSEAVLASLRDNIPDDHIRVLGTTRQESAGLIVPAIINPVSVLCMSSFASLTILGRYRSAVTAVLWPLNVMSFDPLSMFQVLPPHQSTSLSNAAKNLTAVCQRRLMEPSP